MSAALPPEVSAHLCSTCEGFLCSTAIQRDEEYGIIGAGDFSLGTPHHQSFKALQEAVRNKCHICRLIWHRVFVITGNNLLRDRDGISADVTVRHLKETGQGELQICCYVLQDNNSKFFRLGVSIDINNGEIQNSPCFYLEAVEG